ncbi:hypothetical protein KRX57_04250 [Weeksellaceae bacterium TAE3-ERU29]|nr:hypothetical protein [Weeksellaceae bacterium TAE3-ERU29]
MKEITNKFIVISTIIAFVALYLFFGRKEDVTHELVLMNAVGGAIGMAIGLIIYRRILKNNSSDSDKD